MISSVEIFINHPVKGVRLSEVFMVFPSGLLSCFLVLFWLQRNLLAGRTRLLAQPEKLLCARNGISNCVLPVDCAGWRKIRGPAEAVSW